MVKRLLKSRLTSALGFLSGIVVAFIAFFLLFVHTDFFASTASRMVSRSLLGGTPFSLRFERITGNPFQGVEFSDVLVRYDGPEFSFDLLRIERMAVRYSPMDLLGGTARIEFLELDKPHLWIKPDSTGAWILPGGGGEGASFAVDAFVIRGGQAIVQEQNRAHVLRGIETAGRLRAGPDSIVAHFDGGSGQDLAGIVSVRSLSGGIALVGGGEGRGSRILLDNLRVDLEESSFLLEGTVDLDPVRFDARIDAEPIDIEEIALALRMETGHFGELQGSLLVRGRPDSIRVAGTLNGILSGFALDELDLDVVVVPGMVDILSCDGVLNGAGIAGKGVFLRSAPGTLDLDLDVENLDLSAGFVRDTELPETSFNGRALIRYETETGNIAFSFGLGPGHFRGLPFDEGVFLGSWARDTLFADRFEMVGPGHRIGAHGSIAGGDSVRLFIDVEATREDTVFGYFGIEEYRADVRLNGLWEGPLDSWRLLMNGTCRNLAYKGATIHAGTLKLAVEKRDSYRVLFDVAGDSLAIGDLEFDGYDLSLDYYHDVTTVKRLYLRRRGVESDIRGEVTGRGSDDEIRFRDVSLHALDESWTSGGRFLVTVTDTSMVFDDLQLHSKLGAIYADGVLDLRTRGLDGEIFFERFGMSLLDRAGILDTPIDGRARGEIWLRGSLDRPDVAFDVRVEGGTIDTVEVDEARLVGRFSGNTLRLDTLAVISLSGGLSARGTIEGLGRDGEGGWNVGSAVADLEVGCEDLELRPLLALAPALPVKSGVFTGRATIVDSLLHPRIRLVGGVRLLEISSLVVPEVELEVHIEEGRLAFGGTIALGAGGGSFDGTIPLRRLERFYAVDADRSMALELFFDDGRLGTLIGVTDLLAEASGRFSVGLRIGGSPDDPVIVGEMSLHDAFFRLAGMEERFAGVNARVSLSDSTVTVHRLDGREGQKGRFDGRGTITLHGWRPHRYDLTVDLEEFLVASFPDVIALVSGRIELGSSMLGERMVPRLTGDLVVNSAEVYYDLGELGGDGGVTEIASSWIAEVDLDIRGNTWLRSDDANVELEGEVTVHHDRRGTYLRGELQLVRGYYNVYNNKFQVTSGTLRFVHAASFRPVVNIEAETRDPEGRRIYLVLSWLQDDVEPILTLTHEDPGYSETDIWKMLGGGVVESGGGEGASWDALSTAQNLAANYIERILNSQMEGVTIEVESRGTAGSDGMAEQETMVAIGKYLSEGLYVKYKQGLSISTARQIEVEYRISKRILLRSEIIRHSEKVLPGQSRRSSDEVNLDIKLRWEF
ncbi:MAG: translocation/assembly module TamB domain-containing protein [Candidatus Krumholzibacteriota bacterium]|nr:translocation/assembly module TamB domain-containing protein [Candidatus Krumholzibacteriota bacterium]